MPKYGLENIHNIVLLSHGGAGKTSLSESMLFNAGVITAWVELMMAPLRRTMTLKKPNAASVSIYRYFP
jgi:translation elongation factor EF-G